MRGTEAHKKTQHTLIQKKNLRDLFILYFWQTSRFKVIDTVTYSAKQNDFVFTFAGKDAFWRTHIDRTITSDIRIDLQCAHSCMEGMRGIGVRVY